MAKCDAVLRARSVRCQDMIMMDNGRYKKKSRLQFEFLLFDYLLCCFFRRTHNTVSVGCLSTSILVRLGGVAALAVEPNPVWSAAITVAAAGRSARLTNVRARAEATASLVGASNAIVAVLAADGRWGRCRSVAWNRRKVRDRCVVGDGGVAWNWGRRPGALIVRPRPVRKHAVVIAAAACSSRLADASSQAVPTDSLRCAQCTVIVVSTAGVGGRGGHWAWCWCNSRCRCCAALRNGPRPVGRDASHKTASGVAGLAFTGKTAPAAAPELGAGSAGGSHSAIRSWGRRYHALAVGPRPVRSDAALEAGRSIARLTLV